MGITATFDGFGAVLRTLEAPDRHGAMANVTLGRPTIAEYKPHNSGHLGAIAGRFANRIAHARFTLDGVEYQLTPKHGPHRIHGGPIGFAQREWTVTTSSPERTVMRLVSEDGDQGFPGRVEAEVEYAIVPPGTLRVTFRATTDKATVINLTIHAYWNLRGEGEGTIEDHVLQLWAGRYLPTDALSIPTGELASVDGTPFDFRTPRRIGERIDADDAQIRIGKGYDHCFVIDRPSVNDKALRLCARVLEPESGRVMEVATTEPGVQFYTANGMSGIVGTSGREYQSRSGFCLETQHFPNSPNEPSFPSTVLRPGEAFHSVTEFRFSVET